MAQDGKAFGRCVVIDESCGRAFKKVELSQSSVALDLTWDGPNRPKCSCSCGEIAAEMESIKLDIVVLQKLVEDRMHNPSYDKVKDDLIQSLKQNLTNADQRCHDLSQKLIEKDNEILKLTEKVRSLEETRQQNVDEGSPKGIENELPVRHKLSRESLIHCLASLPLCGEQTIPEKVTGPSFPIMRIN